MRVASMRSTHVDWRVVILAMSAFALLAVSASAADDDQKQGVPTIVNVMVEWDDMEMFLYGEDFCAEPVVRLNDEKLRVLDVDLNRNRPDEIIAQVPNWVQLRRNVSFSFHIDVSCATARAQYEAMQFGLAVPPEPIPGPQGPQGEEGQQGPQGQQGAQGLPGLNGAPGTTVEWHEISFRCRNVEAVEGGSEADDGHDGGSGGTGGHDDGSGDDGHDGGSGDDGHGEVKCEVSVDCGANLIANWAYSPPKKGCGPKFQGFKEFNGTSAVMVFHQSVLSGGGMQMPKSLYYSCAVPAR